MIVMSLVDGDSLTSVEWGGEITVFWGFVMLVALGVSAPPLLGFSVMTLAGISWGFYTLAGKHPADAVAGTTFNFIKAVPVAVFLLMPYDWQWSTFGMLLPALSGSLASDVGYTIWYEVLALLKPIQAAVIQLAAPFTAAGGEVLLAGEVISVRLP